MARTVEQVLRDQIGALVFQTAALQARLEAAEERIKELEREAAERG